MHISTFFFIIFVSAYDCIHATEPQQAPAHQDSVLSTTSNAIARLSSTSDDFSTPEEIAASLNSDEIDPYILYSVCNISYYREGIRPAITPIGVAFEHSPIHDIVNTCGFFQQLQRQQLLSLSIFDFRQRFEKQSPISECDYIVDGVVTKIYLYSRMYGGRCHHISSNDKILGQMVTNGRRAIGLQILSKFEFVDVYLAKMAKSLYNCDYEFDFKSILHR